uniref:NB-ARC domain-containing protein n=1 Tax=Oryza glumipatula TaxID=40148 RepID=A0A0D9ZV88_9ORYZ
MAEGIVFSVICKIGSILGNNVAQTLSAQLGKEVTIIVEIERHARMIECELKMMRSFLHDAQGKTRYNKQTVTYLQEVQRLVFEIEDILDEFANLFGKYQAESDKLFKCFRKPSVSCWHNIANNLKDVQIRLDNFRDMKLQYDISFVENTLPREDEEQFRLLFPYQMDTNNIVGMSMLKQQLEECLLTGEKSMKVIGISGLGGSGKSSLAKAIYEAKRIKEYFDLRVWIKVPIRCQLENILRMIIQGAVKETGPMDLCNKGIEDLVCIIQRTFCQRRFLIVSDDVWDMKYFEYLINVLGETRSGSRVLSTSRKHGSHHVSFHCFIRGLNEEDSWNLFRTWAFKNMVDESFVGEVEGLARQILSRCHGLPLAIMAVSSLLSYKGSVREWEIFCDRLNWELDDDVCMFTGLDWAGRMISLIYHHLPKDCFMTRKRLIRLWVAEGLIEPSGSRTLEDTAEDYLNGLISWCLLNVVETNVFGRVKQCEMHGFMRDIALSESHKDKFCKVYENSTGRTSDDLGALTCPSHHLEKLLLNGRLQDIMLESPLLKQTANSLKLLSLENSMLNADPLPQFSCSCNLVALTLSNAFAGKQLHFRDGWFPMLQQLDLSDLCNVELITIEEHSIKKLSELSLSKMTGLKEEFMKNIEGAAGAELQGVALVRYFDQAEQSMKVDCRDKLKEEESEETCHDIRS